MSVERSKIPPRSSAQTEIVQMLVIQKSMTFTQLQNKLKLSRPALSRHLSSLMKENTLEFEKRGREKHYSLSKKAFDTWERKIGIFSSNYISYLEKKWSWPKEDESYLTSIEAYEDIGKKIGIFYLYTLLKSMETGKNWIDAVNSKRMFEDLAKVMLDFLFLDERVKGELSSDDILMTMGENDWKAFFIETKKMIKSKKKKKQLDTMFQELEKLYPQEFKAIKRSEKEELISLFDFDTKRQKN